jgi:hypothetical protein
MSRDLAAGVYLSAAPFPPLTLYTPPPYTLFSVYRARTFKCLWAPALIPRNEFRQPM